MFSRRVPGTLSPNRLSAALAARASAGRALIDLTVSNPTAVGLRYPEDLLEPLAAPAALRYRPEPFGMMTARAAVAGDYARRGIEVAPQRIVLTTSTSEAYSLLFKLLCAPSGDDVLAPVPSYPLFEHLTQLDGVGIRTYALEFHGRWELDVHSVDEAWTENTRAVLAVSPNNPTGSTLTGVELEGLGRRCAERHAALIVDEVFADYPLRPPGGGVQPGLIDPSGMVRPAPEAVSFHLGGLSKSAGLPQVKLGWIAVDGPEARVAEALARLELICDTYLSVSTPVQAAAAHLIARGAGIREQILERVRANYATLQQLAVAAPSVHALPADAGWSAVVRVPAHTSEEELVLELLERYDVLVHPGFFFDFPHEAFLVVSLLPDPAVFGDGVGRVMEHLRG